MAIEDVLDQREPQPGAALRAALADISEIAEPAAFDAALTALGERQAKVRLDPGRTSQWIADRLAFLQKRPPRWVAADT